MSSNFVYLCANEETFFLLKQDDYRVCILRSCYSVIHLESLFRGKKAFHAIDDAIDETLFL